jgi:DASS family divalent anion:Na+ symporter
MSASEVATAATPRPHDAPARPHDAPALPPIVSLALLAVQTAVILWVVPRPEAISVQGWRMVAIFFATIVSLMLRPLPGGACVLIGVATTILTGVLPITKALAAYGGTNVWQVMAAFFIARALINSGLARRIALLFIRAMGHTSLGLGYSLVASDIVLASAIPSNSARVGGVVFPITRSLSVIYKSLPGPTAALLGTFLMLTIYHGDMVAAAMFFTGQASNPMGADLARKTAGVSINWATWLRASIVPGLAAAVAVPWMIYRLSPPEIRRTPEAAEMARRDLREMGPMKRDERIVLAVFIIVCVLWATSSWHPIQSTTVGLFGTGLLLATGALSWGDAVREHVAWDVFVWYGGLISLGEALNEFGVTKVFAGWVAGHFSGWSWPALMVAIVLIYFYTHYGFASLTAHFIALYAPFLAVLVAAGAPPALAAYALAFYTNLSASLTHYGTTHSPIIFAAGYIGVGTWWRIGLLVSFLNLAVWTAVGLPWWKFLGLW